MIPLFKPYVPKVAEIESIMYSGLLSYGDYTKSFEQKLKEYFQTDFLIVTNSFSSAISVAITTLGIEPGSEIIASPMACLVSTQSFLTCGLNIRWADVNPLSGTLDPISVRKQITSKTKAIIHNHFCGYPGYIDEINAIGKEYKIPIIDDGIECFGTEYKGKKIGHCGTDVTVFSLSSVRFCNCIDGGVVIFKDENQYKNSLLIRDCGIDRLKFRDEIGEISPNCDINQKGFSATMSNINGYIGLKQMEEIDILLYKHRENAKLWATKFKNDKSIKTINRIDCNPNYWVFGILVDDKIKAIKKYREEGFYASSVHIRNDLYSVFGKQDISLPGVDYFSNSFIALPCGWWIKNELSNNIEEDK